MKNGHECYIIGAGDFHGFKQEPDDSDYIIAADAGYLVCCENNIIPDLVLGDFDSLGEVPKHPNVMELPVEKDDTDTMFAIKLGLERGYHDFYIYGGLGGSRADHTIANLQSLLYIANRGGRGWIFGSHHVWTLIKNSAIRLEGEGNVAVFCPDGIAEGVSLKGLKYELENAVVTSDYPLGVSNCMDASEAEISVTNGALLIMYDLTVGEKD